MEDLLGDVKQSAHNLLDVREWKERLSPYEALTIAIELQRNKILHETLTSLEPGVFPVKRTNLFEKLTTSLDEIAQSLKNRGI